MNHPGAIADFDDNGRPVPTVGFAYPEDDPQGEGRDREAEAEILLMGIKAAIGLFIDWVANARTDKARRVRLEAMRFVFAPHALNVTDTAARLKVRREHFQRQIAHVQELNTVGVLRSQYHTSGKTTHR